MKKTTLCTALIIACAMPAFAGTDSKEIAPASCIPPSDAGVYVALYGGANFAQNYGDPRANVAVGPLSEDLGLKNNSDVGAVGGLKVGYNFASFPIGGNFRLQPAVEGEAFYLGTKVSGNASLLGSGVSFQGDMDNAAFMVNGLLRLKTGTIFTPYIGAGIGAEYLTLTNTTISSVFGNASLHNADDVCFAMQAVGGFDVALTRNWTLFTEYKYITAFDPETDGGSVGVGGVSLGDVKLNADYIGQHLITAGVKYNF